MISLLYHTVSSSSAFLPAKDWQAVAWLRLVIGMLGSPSPKPGWRGVVNYHVNLMSRWTFELLSDSYRCGGCCCCCWMKGQGWVRWYCNLSHTSGHGVMMLLLLCLVHIPLWNGHLSLCFCASWGMPLFHCGASGILQVSLCLSFCLSWSSSLSLSLSLSLRLIELPLSHHVAGNTRGVWVLSSQSTWLHPSLPWG